MTGGEGSPGRGVDSAAQPPTHLRRALPADTANAWQALAPHLPPELYLGGGTGVAVHLGHRTSRDLDFFFHRPIDLEELGSLLGELGPFAVTHVSDGTLKGLFAGTNVEVFDASGLRLLAEPAVVAGIKVADLLDLMAMKLKVLDPMAAI
jgi:Nucleotidyl transferase AbiEii toxin, Type IV TA system